MTEIEKSMQGMWDEIDLNGLVDELGSEFNELHGMIIDNARRIATGEQINELIPVGRIFVAATDVMQAVNAMFNKIDAYEWAYPFILAGVATFVDALKETFDDGERKIMETLEDTILSKSKMYCIRKVNHDED